MNKPLRQVQTIYEIPGEMTEDEAADFYGSHNLGEVWEELETMQEPVKLSAKRISQALAAHFAGREEVVAVYLFGSHAQGRADHLSDVDVALLLRDELPDAAHLELRLISQVYDALGTENVDVVILNDAPLRIQAEVIQTGQLLICNDSAARIEYEVRTMSKWWDLKPLLETYDRILFQRLKDGFTDEQRRAYERARRVSTRAH